MLVISFFSTLEATPYQNLFKPCLENPTSSIDGIDGIYVINLDFRPEKWHRLQPILYFYGIDHCRFSAVCGMDFDIPTLKTYAKKHMIAGQLGCMLSHLSIYHDALKRGLEVIWVLEDDAEIRRNPNVLTEIIEELNQVDPYWDVLYTDMDWVKEDGSPVRSLALPIDKKKPLSYPLEYYTHREKASKNIEILRSRYGTGSMIVSARGMRKILHHFTTDDDIIWPYDIEIHYVPELRQYGLPDPVVTNGHFSFNYSDAGLGMWKRNYYEIDDEHVEEIERKYDLLREINFNWLDFLGLKKTNF